MEIGFKLTDLIIIPTFLGHINVVLQLF